MTVLSIEIRIMIPLFQYDAHITQGDEEQTLFEAAQRTWNATQNKAQAWECKCNSYFSGLQCETPGTHFVLN